MRWGMRALSCLGILASLFLVLSTTGCGGSASVGPVTATATATTVDGTDTTTLTAAVTSDRNAAGVTWSTSAGTLSGQTTTSATFTAPAATSSSQTITITATSVADTTKTGTATMPYPGRDQLLTGDYNASFVGFAPANAPVLSMIVVIERPQTTIYGGAVAAPIFQEVMSYALHHYNIPSNGTMVKPLKGAVASIASDVT